MIFPISSLDRAAASLFRPWPGHGAPRLIHPEPGLLPSPLDCPAPNVKLAAGQPAR